MIRMPAARRSLLLLGLALAVAGPLAAPRSARADKVKDDDVLNYFMKIPDTWNFGRAEDFAKQFVVAVADRVLDVLADGKTAGTGQGARVMLSVQDLPKDFEPDYETWLYEWQMLESQIANLPEGTDIPEELAKKDSVAKEKLEKPLQTLAGRPDVQSLLLSRWFGDVKKQPVMEPDARGIFIGHIPAAEMKYEGNCANLQGNDGPCQGRLYVWIVRKKLYRMAFWTWPNQYDRERLRDDVDTIQYNYETPKPTAIPKKAPDPTKANDPNEPKGDPDLAKVFMKKDLAFQFEIKKVARFKAIAVDRTRADQKHLGYRMDGIAGPSSCICELLVYPVKNAAEPFSVDQYLSDFWTMFLKSHPNGKLETAPFPLVTAKSPFFSLPDFTKKREVPRPEKKPGKDKEEKLTVNDEEKLGIITESKMVTISKEKVKNAWRMCLLGNAERLGDEANIQYMFQTSDFCYVLRFVCRRDGVPAFKESMAEILASIGLLEPPK
jgi:hypothetical protein